MKSMVSEEVIDKSEYKRVRQLAELDLDYVNLQEEFKDLTRLAASIAGTEISLVNLLDSFTQWSVSGTTKFDPMPREDSVCTYTLQEPRFFEVPRLDKDFRFSTKNYVNSEDGFTYYLGIPLKMPTGLAVGALCVLSRDEKKLTGEQVSNLEIVAKEIVRRLRLKLDLNKAQKKADKERDLKERLAHDIRGPVSGIVELLKLAQAENYSSPELKEILKIVGESGTNILTLTEDILQEAVAEREKSKDFFTLDSLADKLIALYSPQAQSKNVNLNIGFAHEFSTRFSRKNLLPVTGNLISNAIKFTPTGGSVSVFLDIAINDREKELLVEVRDTGIGMTPDKLKNLTSDDLISEQGTAGEKGFGFGLRLVKDLVDELDGRLEASSKVGSGTVIKIYTPIRCY